MSEKTRFYVLLGLLVLSIALLFILNSNYSDSLGL